ncbi:lipoyl protein ligase domain-containing protein, partial [Aeromonas salmonicida]|uniref:lipoyl protein ligase domain-containing protein n=1 Tax=Aeromonas salmonicida TaxID=645 RepID=UPI003D3183F0
GDVYKRPAPQSRICPRKGPPLPRYQAACEQLAREGWPVHVRDSGGTAVPHGAGILNLSLLLAGTGKQTRRCIPL